MRNDGVKRKVMKWRRSERNPQQQKKEHKELEIKHIEIPFHNVVKNEHSIITIYIKYLHFNQTPNKQTKKKGKKKKENTKGREGEREMENG